MGAVVAVFALTLLGVAGVAAADERSDAVSERTARENEIKTLRGDLDGINQEIADLIVVLEETTVAVDAAEVELTGAEEELAAAERHHKQIEDQLAQAVHELEQVTEEIGASEVREEELSHAVGDMARDLYRGGSTSPLDVVIQNDSVGDVNQRTAAATSLSRVQSMALGDVKNGLVVKENQMVRQEAVTERITTLEEEAAVARDQAEEARNRVQEDLAALEGLLAQQQSARSEWESKKAGAIAQIDEAQEQKLQADATIARIDRENAERQTVFEQPSAPAPSAPSPAPAPAPSPTPSPPQTSSPAPSGGALFVNPFRFPMYVTSSFGYRIHPIFGYSLLHTGTDLAAGCGTSQYATRAGVVAQTGYNGGLGYFVRVNHGMINGSSYITEHGHLSQILVSQGQSVTTNSVLGLTGTTGNSTGCHLHLGLLRNGTYVNIMGYM